jgi:hypothetical protein
MLAFTVVLLELGMWSRTLHTEQRNVKLFFLAHTVASIVTSGLQGVIDYILAYMEHFRQPRFCVNSRLHIMTLCNYLFATLLDCPLMN